MLSRTRITLFFFRQFNNILKIPGDSNNSAEDSPNSSYIIAISICLPCCNCLYVVGWGGGRWGGGGGVGEL